jgi:CRISP-associated protein Cas1
LRLLEANSAAAYFRAWQKIPIKWQNSSRRPIPSDWRIFGSRSSRLNSDGNRNASHPINSMLNYAYAVLQSNLQIQAVAAGYDPNLGIMHFDREYGPAFVFDLMEPERPKVDQAIISFLISETLHPADFVIRTDGVVRLNPQLARHVVSMVATVVDQRGPAAPR